jgi:hypothetical protein
VLVALNKTEGPLPLRIDLKGVPAFKTVSVFRLTAAESKPAAEGDLAPADRAALTLELPPLSVSTFVLKP